MLTRFWAAIAMLQQKGRCLPLQAPKVSFRVGPLLQRRRFSQGQSTTDSECPPSCSYHYVHLSQGAGTYKVRKSVVACSGNGTSDPSMQGFEQGVIKGGRIKFNTNDISLRMRRRAYIKWEPGHPKSVLLVKKPKAPAASAKLKEIGQWLKDRGINVFVERTVYYTECQQFQPFEAGADNVDFCITLGGDGTVLHLASLFENDEPMPPVMSFAMGTVGFLTPFDASHALDCLSRILDTSMHPFFCTLRTRKRCEVWYKGTLQCVHHTLNEVVVDRGSCSKAVILDCFMDGNFLTTIEADGLIIATPSGSTAYSMSAGGPMIAPSVPCTVMTPIAPHSLSFRPLVIPETSSICIQVPSYAASPARASFDGNKALLLKRNSSLYVTTSLCPLPFINMGSLDRDFYEGITHKLKWNQTIKGPPKQVLLDHNNVSLQSGDLSDPDTVDGPPSDDEYEDPRIPTCDQCGPSLIGI